ncbi:MAG: hypothetical protein LUD07_09300 [Clostridiales bacterium]|nr:hypothetical protein [Clostridiales bacterium]
MADQECRVEIPLDFMPADQLITLRERNLLFLAGDVVVFVDSGSLNFVRPEIFEINPAGVSPNCAATYRF